MEQPNKFQKICFSSFSPDWFFAKRPDMLFCEISKSTNICHVFKQKAVLNIASFCVLFIFSHKGFSSLFTILAFLVLGLSLLLALLYISNTWKKKYRTKDRNFPIYPERNTLMVIKVVYVPIILICILYS